MHSTADELMTLPSTGKLSKMQPQVVPSDRSNSAIVTVTFKPPLTCDCEGWTLSSVGHTLAEGAVVQLLPSGVQTGGVISGQKEHFGLSAPTQSPQSDATQS